MLKFTNTGLVPKEQTKSRGKATNPIPPYKIKKKYPKKHINPIVNVIGSTVTAIESNDSWDTVYAVISKSISLN